MTQQEVQKAFDELGFIIPETEEQLKAFNEKFSRCEYKTDHMRIDPNKAIGLVKKEANKYQEFFDFMSQEHNLTLTISEMDEILTEAIKLNKRLNSCSHGDFHVVNGIFQCKHCRVSYIESNNV